MGSITQFGGIIAVATLAIGVAANSERRIAPAPPPFETPAYAKSVNARVEARAAAAIVLRPISIDLPTADTAFPPGPGADLVASNCQSCHSPGMILTQPALTQAEWTGEVTKMIRIYKAPVAETDAPGIVAYLAAMKVAP